MFGSKSICSCFLCMSVVGVSTDSVYANSMSLSHNVRDVLFNSTNNGEVNAQDIKDDPQSYNPYEDGDKLSHVQRRVYYLFRQGGEKSSPYLQGYNDGYRAAYLQAHQHVLLNQKNSESQSVAVQEGKIDYSLVRAFDSP